MMNKILLTFIGFDVLFLACAMAHLLVPLLVHASLGRPPTLNNVASDVLLDHCPLTVSLINSILMFSVFLLSIPGIFLSSNRKWLIAYAFGVLACALVTLGIGLAIWFSTLQTQKNLGPIWNALPDSTESLLQQKFQCCGFDNPSLFIKDQTCPTATIAAKLGPCVVPFSSFANQFLDVVFTTFFGFCAIDAMALLSVMCVVKDRKERERFRKIDMKLGHQVL